MPNSLEHKGVKGMRWGKRKMPPTINPSPKKKQSDIALYLTSNDIDKTKARIAKEKKLKQLIDEDIHPGRVAARKIITDIGKTMVKDALGDVRTNALNEFKRDILKQKEKKGEA